jgi:hypothetical protein
LKIRAANAKQGPAALTNKKQDNFNQIHAGNIVNRSAVCNYYHKKFLKKFWSKASEKFNNLPRPLFAPRFTHAGQHIS